LVPVGHPGRATEPFVLYAVDEDSVPSGQSKTGS